PPADPPEADQPEGDAGLAAGPSAEIRPLKPRVPPLPALLQMTVALPHLLEHREHGGDRALGDSAPVRFRGAVRDQDTQLRRGLDVDVVRADRVLRDDAKPV